MTTANIKPEFRDGPEDAELYEILEFRGDRVLVCAVADKGLPIVPVECVALAMLEICES